VRRLLSNLGGHARIVLFAKMRDDMTKVVRC
jgi:hypothetical protein